MDWLKHKRQCPICKQEVHSIDMTTSDKVVLEMGVKLPDLEKKEDDIWSDVSYPFCLIFGGLINARGVLLGLLRALLSLCHYGVVVGVGFVVREEISFFGSGSSATFVDLLLALSTNPKFSGF